MNFNNREPITFAFFSFWTMFIDGAWAQNVVSGKEIYGINRDAVVQIKAGNEFGNGFIVSADGEIFTANHVVATKETHYLQYAKDIEIAVFLGGTVKIRKATPIDTKISHDQVNFDYARLRIKADNLTYVKLGYPGEVSIGDPLTIIPSFPNTGTMLLEGIASGKGLFQVDLGPKAVNGIIFQCPVRNGFSGSPIFDATGRVVAITTTKVFGISVSLDKLRQGFATSGADIAFDHISLSRSFVDVIDNLDQNLISGLGSGVSIEYAKNKQGSSK